MPDLIDRFAGLRDGRAKIPLHSFMAGMAAYIAGSQTVEEVKKGLDLRGRELSDFNQIIAAIDGKTTQEQILYLLKIDGLAIKLEDDDDRIYHFSTGEINKVRIRTDLEIF